MSKEIEFKDTGAFAGTTTMETTLDNDIGMHSAPRDMKNCPIHGDTDAWMAISRNDGGEQVYKHYYCLDCYDGLLRSNLPLLGEPKTKQEGDKQDG